MSERVWTAAQRAAIDYRGKNLLVSAAAGSGKTATLTERIIRLIADSETHADISRMLVVTFTKAAAEELRSRVAAALEELAAANPEDRRISEQLCRVGDATICTMDSFFLGCVKPMFDKVGLPADFRIGDPAELASVRESAMEETVEVFFDSADKERSERFLAVAEAIDSARTEDGLDKILLDFEADADRNGIGETELFEYADELSRHADGDILGTHFGDCVFSWLVSGLRHYANVFSDLAEKMSEDEELMKSYVPAAYRAAEYCAVCLDAAEARDTDRLRALLADTPSDKIRTSEPTDESEMFKKMRSELKDFISELNGGFFSESAEVCADVMNRTAEICRGAGEIVGEFRRRNGELKRRKGIADYSDITKMTASLLADADGTPTPYGETVASRYDHVFIDEYQDTSIFQDRIFASVSSKCGRFMVGDIKQSIYRFRGGEPAVFGGYREAWSRGEGGDTVFMSENFRCSENVTEFANAVSRYMFPYGGIPFDDGDLLVHARAEIEGYAEPPVEVCLIERPSRQLGGRRKAAEQGEKKDEEPVTPSAVLEAEYVAKRIRHMLDFETLPDGSPVKPTDIAVMQRDMKSRIDVIKEVFSRYGIPMNELDDKPLLERPEILLIMCILRAVDNPERDIPLAGAMRSAVFGFDMGQLALIKSIYLSEVGKGSLWEAVNHVAYNSESADGELCRVCRDFCEKLGEYRTAARVMPAAAFIYRLICEPKLVYAIESEGGVGATDRAMQLYELARAGNAGLYEFLVYIEHMEKAGPESRDGTSGGGVSLITVHHSKGLEFPICFLMNCTKKYSRGDSKKHMILDRSFGVALRLPDESGLVRCDNILRRLAVLRALGENSFEEMRVLYVAMTRARERLIVTGVATGGAEKLTGKARMDARFYDEYSVRSKDSWMSIILEALTLYGGGFASVTAVPYERNTEAAEPRETLEVSDGTEMPIAESAATESTAEAAALGELFARRIGFEYGYEHLRNIPSKLTVSRLCPEILDEYDDGAAELESESVKAPSVPRFMTDGAYSPADAGSAAHVFLQFCDFERLSTLGVEAELARLTDEGYMSRAQSEAANLDYIEAFRRSGFFKRILSASEVRREFRFNAAIPAGMLTGDEARREALERDGVDVIAQGVIDIVFTDSDGLLVLADYKTDRLTPYELGDRAASSAKLWRRHGDQLGYYALVCEKLFGKRPNETLIYSMPLGDTV